MSSTIGDGVACISSHRLTDSSQQVNFFPFLDQVGNGSFQPLPLFLFTQISQSCRDWIPVDILLAESLSLVCFLTRGLSFLLSAAYKPESFLDELDAQTNACIKNVSLLVHTFVRGNFLCYQQCVFYCLVVSDLRRSKKFFIPSKALHSLCNKFIAAQ